MRIKIHPSGLRTLVFGKVSHGAPPAPIWLAQDKDTGVFTLAEAPETVKNRKVEKVRHALVQAGRNGLTVAAIVEDTGVSKSTAHEYLKALGAEPNGGKPPRYRLPSESSESDGPDGGTDRDDRELEDSASSASASGQFPPSGVRTVRPKGRTGRTDARTDSGQPDDQANLPFSTDAPL